jgi:hypothetical protein
VGNNGHKDHVGDHLRAYSIPSVHAPTLELRHGGTHRDKRIDIVQGDYQARFIDKTVG